MDATKHLNTDEMPTTARVAIRLLTHSIVNCIY